MHSSLGNWTTNITIIKKYQIGTHLENGVGTEKGGIFKSQSFKFIICSGKEPTANIFCSQCSTQIMSAFSDILLGIFTFLQVLSFLQIRLVHKNLCFASLDLGLLRLRPCENYLVDTTALLKAFLE